MLFGRLLLLSLAISIFSFHASSEIRNTEEFEQLRESIRLANAKDPNEALEYVEKLLQEEDFSVDQRLVVLNYKAWFQVETEHFEEAMRTLVIYKNMVNDATNKDIIYGYYNITAFVYTRLNLYHDALAFFNKALPHAEKLDELLVYQAENNIAEIHLRLGNYKEALSTFSHYRQYSKDKNQPLNETFATINMVQALIGLKRYDEALINIEQGIELQTNNNYERFLIKSLILKGEIQLLTNQLQDAEKTLNQAIQLLSDTKANEEFVEAHLNLAKTYKEQNRIDLASEIIDSIDLSSFQFVDLSTKLNFSEFKYQLYELQNSPQQALQALKEFNIIKTSMLTKQANVNLAKALAETDLATKQARISELTKAEQLKAAKAKAFKDLTIAVSICLVIILFGSFIAISSVDKQKQKLSATIARLRATQQQLIEAEKIASLTSLVSGMAHQLNTPIGTIVTASSLIDDYLECIAFKFKERTLNSKNFHEFIENTTDAKNLVINNINRLAGIVEEFKALNVSFELDKPATEIRLTHFLQDKMSPLDTYLGKHIEFKVSGDDITIISYPTILVDVLKTLVINSYEHGFINQENGVVCIDVIKRESTVDIVYQDNGVGINDEILTEIFTPFYTTNLGGDHLGLGLNVVFNAVQHNLKGDICAKPCEHGARFVISLPIDSRLVDENDH